MEVTVALAECCLICAHARPLAPTRLHLEKKTLFMVDFEVLVLDRLKFSL